MGQRLALLCLLLLCLAAATGRTRHLRRRKSTSIPYTSQDLHLAFGQQLEAGEFENQSPRLSLLDSEIEQALERIRLATEEVEEAKRNQMRVTETVAEFRKLVNSHQSAIGPLITTLSNQTEVYQKIGPSKEFFEYVNSHAVPGATPIERSVYFLHSSFSVAVAYSNCLRSLLASLSRLADKEASRDPDYTPAAVVLPPKSKLLEQADNRISLLEDYDFKLKETIEKDWEKYVAVRQALRSAFDPIEQEKMLAGDILATINSFLSVSKDKFFEARRAQAAFFAWNIDFNLAHDLWEEVFVVLPKQIAKKKSVDFLGKALDLSVFQTDNEYVADYIARQCPVEIPEDVKKQAEKLRSERLERGEHWNLLRVLPKLFVAGLEKGTTEVLELYHEQLHLFRDCPPPIGGSS